MFTAGERCFGDGKLSAYCLQHTVYEMHQCQKRKGRARVIADDNYYHQIKRNKCLDSSSSVWKWNLHGVSDLLREGGTKRAPPGCLGDDRTNQQS